METVKITFYEIANCDVTGILLTTSKYFFSNMEFDEEDMDKWRDEYADDPAWANQTYEQDVSSEFELNFLLDLFDLNEVDWPKELNWSL